MNNLQLLKVYLQDEIDHITALSKKRSSSRDQWRVEAMMDVLAVVEKLEREHKKLVKAARRA